MSAQTQDRQLPHAYATVERIVATYDADGDGDKARTDLIRVANTLSPESQAILADICALTIIEGRLDREIAAITRERQALLAKTSVVPQQPHYMRGRPRAR